MTKMVDDPLGHGWVTISEDLVHATSVDLMSVPCFVSAATHRRVSGDLEVVAPA
jgi:hypothetical protein